MTFAGALLHGKFVVYGKVVAAGVPEDFCEASMEWYYADNDRRVGPVADAEFQALVSSGTITDSTMVWQGGMADWAEYGKVAEDARTSSLDKSGYVKCVECGLSFAHDEVIEFQGSYICGGCKPVFF